MGTISLIAPRNGDTQVVYGRTIVGPPGQAVQVTIGEAFYLIASGTGWTGTRIPTNYGPMDVTEFNEPVVLGSNGDLVNPFTGLPPGIKRSAAPALASVAGGALAATTYFVRTSYQFPNDVSVPSNESRLLVSINNLLKVTSPPPYSGATVWNVYVGAQPAGSNVIQNTKQNVAPIAIGTDWTEPTSGLIVGVLQP